jgi:hypothetical protein
VNAQDSASVKSQATFQSDTLKQKVHSPLFAGIASAVIPGAGQVYNQKYWKVPIVYAALGTVAYFAYYNAHVYYTVHNNINSRIAEDTTFGEPQFLKLNNIFSKSTIDLNQYSTSDLISIEDEYRRYFTLSIIIGSVVYVLNILDAVVDAHLFYFDVSEDLSMNVRPEIFYANSYRPAPGFSLSLNLK